MQMTPVGVLSSSAGVVRPGAAQPVEAVRRLESAAGHDPSLCEHCLAGAIHQFSSDGDEIVVSETARRGERSGADRQAESPGRQEQAGAAEQAGSGIRLTEEELAQVRELAARDREVRAHEHAHLAAAGPYARGGPAFTYQTGPDGKRYAVGGEVSIDTSPVPGDPQETLRKARTIMAAANAPAEPSAQDRAVAAAALALAAQAQAELARASAVARYAQGEEAGGGTLSLAA